MRFLTVFLCALSLTLPAMAAPPAPAARAAPVKAAAKNVPAPAADDTADNDNAPAKPLTDADKADIKKAEEYLNGLKTARARFVQTTHDGTQLVGTFYLSRPGKLRFEYDPPVEDFVVADGLFIYFYDAELKEQSNAPIGQTLADFILRDHLKLSGDLRVTGVRHTNDLLQIDVVQSSDPEAGRLVLGFKDDKDDPFTLKKWRVIDAQGLITEVELFYLKTDVSFPGGLFVYKNPAKGGKMND